MYSNRFILERCYSQSDVICQLMNNVSFDVLESDLKKALNAALLDLYYESIVMQHFRGALSSCNHAKASSLAEKVAPLTEEYPSLCFLIIWNPQLGLTLEMAEKLTLTLAEKLYQSSTDFKIVNHDPLTSANCQNKSQGVWNVGSFEYYLVY